MANKAIIISTLGITGTGILKDVATGGTKPIGNILVGGYVLALLASLADLAGGAVSRIVGMIMGLALFASIMYVLFGAGILTTAIRKIQGGGTS